MAIDTDARGMAGSVISGLKTPGAGYGDTVAREALQNAPVVARLVGVSVATNQAAPKWNPQSRLLIIPTTAIKYSGGVITLAAGNVTLTAGSQVLLLPLSAVSNGAIGTASLVQESVSSGGPLTYEGYIPLVRVNNDIVTGLALPDPIGPTNYFRHMVVNCASATKVEVLLPGSRHHSDAGVRLTFARNARNVGSWSAEGDNSDTWRLSAVDEGVRTGLTSFTPAVSLTGDSTTGSITESGGEWDVAVLTSDAGTFVGGRAHGNEVATAAEWYVDGIKVTPGVEVYVCNEFVIRQKSTLYQSGSTSSALATVYKRWAVTNEGAQLTVYIEWSASKTITWAYCGMISSRQAVFSSFTRHPKYDNETYVDGTDSSNLERTDRVVLHQTSTQGVSVTWERLNPQDAPTAKTRISPFTSGGIAKLKVYPSILPTGTAVTAGSTTISDTMFRFATRRN